MGPLEFGRLDEDLSCVGCTVPEIACRRCPRRDDWPDESDDRGHGRSLVRGWG